MPEPKWPPSAFGGDGIGCVAQPQWTLPEGADMSMLLAAVVHHTYVFRWWTMYRLKWRSTKAFCLEAGLSVDEFGRVVRGERWIEMSDIGALVQTLADNDLVDALPTPQQFATEMQRARRLVAEAQEGSEQGGQEALQDTLAVGHTQSQQADILIAMSSDMEALMEQQVLEDIRAVAEPAFRHSTLHLRKQWFPEYPPEPRIDLEVVAPRPNFHSVHAMPTDESIFGSVQLDEAWLNGARSTGVVEVDGHFVIAYRFDGNEQLVEIDALRLLPTAWSPAVPPPCEPEYASSPAAVEWVEGTPHLTWKQEDLLEAAATWIARFPPEMLVPAD